MGTYNRFSPKLLTRELSRGTLGKSALSVPRLLKPQAMTPAPGTPTRWQPVFLAPPLSRVVASPLTFLRPMILPCPKLKPICQPHTDMPTPPKNRGGRPIDKTTAFGARILAVELACTDRHARRLLDESIANLSVRGWYAVAATIEAGITTADACEVELRRRGYFR